MSRGPSKLQRRIVDEAAVLIINSCKDFDHPYGCSAGCMGDARVPDLLTACGDYWPLLPDRSFELQARTARSSFSRALHTLYDHGFIFGLALAWMYIDADKHEDLWGWQGGGRQRDPNGFNTPRLRRVGLLDAGWALTSVRASTDGSAVSDVSLLQGEAGTP